MTSSPEHSGQTIAEVVEDLGLEMIAETAELIGSLAISLGQAAFRRDHAEVRLHLGRLRLALIAAIQTDRELNGEGNAP
jgi:hypothetical protein